MGGTPHDIVPNLVVGPGKQEGSLGDHLETDELALFRQVFVTQVPLQAVKVGQAVTARVTLGPSLEIEVRPGICAGRECVEGEEWAGSVRGESVWRE